MGAWDLELLFLPKIEGKPEQNYRTPDSIQPSPEKCIFSGTPQTPSSIRQDSSFAPSSHDRDAPPPPPPFFGNSLCLTLHYLTLPPIARQYTVRQTFGECGDIKSVCFGEDRKTGEFRGFGYVEFFDASCVDAAVELSGLDVMGRPIRVRNSRVGGIICHLAMITSPS